MMQDENQDTINSIFATASVSAHDNVSATLFASSTNDNTEASSSISESQIAASQYPIEVNIYSFEERAPQQPAPQASGRPLLDSLRKLKTSVASSNTFVVRKLSLDGYYHSIS